MASNGGVSCFLKLFFGTLALVPLETQGGSTKTATSTAVAPESFSEKPADVVGREKQAVHPELDLNYMSKEEFPMDQILFTTGWFCTASIVLQFFVEIN
ncbi:CLAVATA3/ESR (CLE)-related protein 25 [Prunus yedoensis var. nudiflora]|uniref:CLAVATA3/ESR (CLE)-related protein 25 n=1 Tax=Prunus yedoensis var. nudiflora TaxID=2094558 RepID=A0A314YHK5_PRUYE|nr:CLAVATA3/ESR (CLE)-related protein 25 [Prunus yedoensis var. nudiflora]